MALGSPVSSRLTCCLINCGGINTAVSSTGFTHELVKGGILNTNGIHWRIKVGKYFTLRRNYVREILSELVTRNGAGVGTRAAILNPN